MNSIYRFHPFLHMPRLRGWFGLLMLALVVMVLIPHQALSQPTTAQPSSTAVTDAATPAVAALWQPYEVSFHYFGFTTYYTCSGLENRLEQILKEMGADPDVRVMASGCFGLNDVSNMLSAQVRVRMPALRGGTEGQSFAAISKAVTLSTHRLGEIGAGDCELLEQVRDQLLPALKLTLLKDDLHCVPGQSQMSGQRLQIQALVAQPVKH